MTEIIDPFNPAALRLVDNLNDGIQCKRLLTVVPVRKPGPQDFVRVHPGEEYRLSPIGLVTIEETRDTYLVSPQVAQDIPETKLHTLYTAITRSGTVFLWPIKLPAVDGRQNLWNASQADAAEKAISSWIKIASNQAAGFYDVHEAAGPIPEPIWPEADLQYLLKIAFSNRLINSLDHPVVKQLTGAM